MPVRFVEVVDVQAEASGLLASLLANGHAITHSLSFNFSDYLNTSSVTVDALREAFAIYNLTIDSLPVGWSDTAVGAVVAAALNQAVVEVPPLQGSARQLIIAGLAMIVSREVVVQWLTRSLLRRHGVHATDGHSRGS